MNINLVLRRSMFLVLLFFLTGPFINAQVAVNTVTPNAGSISDFNTTDKGILIPRVNIENLSTIAPITGGSAESLLVYNTNTTTGKGYYYWDGTSWTGFTGSGSGNDDWKLLGNLTTNPPFNFIGTTDNQPFVNRTKGIENMRLLTDGSLGLNTSATGDGSILDVNSSSKAILIPRVDISDLSTIAPVSLGTEGLLVYNTNVGTGKGFHYWDGNDWILIGVNIAGGDDWKITGNSGTNISTNYLGTSDDQDYIFRTNGIERMRLTSIGSEGRLGINTTTPSEILDVSGDIIVGGNDNLTADKSAEKLNIYAESTDWELGVNNDASVNNSHFFFGRNGVSNYNQNTFYIDQPTNNISIGDGIHANDIVHIYKKQRDFTSVRIDNNDISVPGTVNTSMELWAGTNEKGFFRHKNADDLLEIGHGISTGQIDFQINATSILNISNGITTITGNLSQTGMLNKGSFTFRIDHPLDPLNKYLDHSGVESPDMLNIYDGIVTTDEKGKAIIEMPSYFEALNRDFQYQFTTIGSFSKVMVTQEISGNSFEILSQKPNVKISWQVTGIRQDPYAIKNRIIPEVEKEDHKKGLYLYPESYNNIE